MPKYRIIIEGPGLIETQHFEAATDNDAALIGRDIFYNTCNYGITRVEGEESGTTDDGGESEN